VIIFVRPIKFLRNIAKIGQRLKDHDMQVFTQVHGDLVNILSYLKQKK